jgi:hypothetical protein
VASIPRSAARCYSSAIRYSRSRSTPSPSPLQ